MTMTSLAMSAGAVLGVSCLLVQFRDLAETVLISPDSANLLAFRVLG